MKSYPHGGGGNLLVLTAVLMLSACVLTSSKKQAIAAPAAAASPEATKDCHCDENPADKLRGFGFKGLIVAVLPDENSLRVTHADVSGALPAGTHEFKADPDTIKAVEPGREILARIEQRNGEWWLFDVRVLIPVNAIR